MFSKKLDERIVVVSDEAEAAVVRLSGRAQGNVIYTKAEILLLNGQPVELIRTVHEAKRVFNGCLISLTLS